MADSRFFNGGDLRMVVMRIVASGSAIDLPHTESPENCRSVALE
jgi:hypothetical protein